MCQKPNIFMCHLKMLRDVKQNQSLDMRLITPAQDSGTTICNPIAIDSPTSIGSFPRNYPRFIPLSLQVN